MIITYDMAGQCDIRAMTYVLNAHLRRHDTYHSWFEYQDTKHILRHRISDPGDIEYVPTDHGQMTSADLQNHVLATPNPLQWDCFSFGIIQRDDHFTIYAVIDHLHMDGMIANVLVTESQTMYTTLVGGGAPVTFPDVSSYEDYCVRQHRYASALTLQSPQVRTWVEFGEHNDASLPCFPLPLGDPSLPCSAGLLTEQLLNDVRTARFESACVAAGARFSGGVFACAALCEYEITGAPTYYGLTPIDTRKTLTEFLTVGWFTGLIPITVPVAGASFGEAARAAQSFFDSDTDLAHVSWDRVLDLAPWLSRPRPNFPVINFMDAGVAPFSGLFTSLIKSLNCSVWLDGRYSYQFCVWVSRMENETVMTVLFPDNPVARESVARYVRVMKSCFVRVADAVPPASLTD